MAALSNPLRTASCAAPGCHRHSVRKRALVRAQRLPADLRGRICPKSSRRARGCAPITRAHACHVLARICRVAGSGAFPDLGRPCAPRRPGSSALPCTPRHAPRENPLGKICAQSHPIPVGKYPWLHSRIRYAQPLVRRPAATATPSPKEPISARGACPPARTDTSARKAPVAPVGARPSLAPFVCFCGSARPQTLKQRQITFHTGVHCKPASIQPARTPSCEAIYFAFMRRSAAELPCMESWPRPFKPAASLSGAPQDDRRRTRRHGRNIRSAFCSMPPRLLSPILPTAAAVAERLFHPLQWCTVRCESG
jgi:hypothetical protein